MKLYSDGENYKLYQGSMLDMLEVIEPCSIDAILTDPPYELNFMNKDWDNSGIAFQKETWEKCLQALKHGGYLLAFGGSRTFHRIACAIEDAGFEIRDTIMWLYGSGFPKSMNLGLAIDRRNDSVGDANLCKSTNEWGSWGTSLKPAYEPVIVARKPCDGSTIDNVLKYGVGGLNIDECRIDHDEQTKYTNRQPKNGAVFNTDTSGYDNSKNHVASADPDGRFPSNVILTYDKTDEHEVCGGMPNTTSGSLLIGHKRGNGTGNSFVGGGGVIAKNYGGDSGSASRYYYCAKASRKDRDDGLDAFPLLQKYYCDGSANSLEIFGSTDGGRAPLKNVHPCVKPTNLMQYLVRLVTPNGGIVLDPFNGSGSTGKAVMYENKERNKGYSYIGIDLNEQYLQISKARIDYVNSVDTVEIVTDTSSGKTESFSQSSLF